MKLLGRTKKDVDKDKDGEIVPKLEPVEVVLMSTSTRQKFYLVCSKQTIWTVNKYFTTPFNDDKHS